MAQREETHAEQQVTNLAEENLILTQEPRGEIETKNPNYAATKENITKLSKEIAASRKRKRTQQQQQQGKGKCKLIIAEYSKDEEELVAMSLDIIEYATVNKVPVETQF